MSTKIYEAWKVAAPVETILPQLMRFRKRAQAQVKRKIGSFIHFQDKGYLDWYKIAKEEIQSGQRGLFAMQMSLMMFPVLGGTLLMGFGLSDARVKLRLKGFEDYAYWNNTDEPEGMDANVWKHRGMVWDSILDKGGGVPSRCAGVVFELVTPEDIYKMIFDLNYEWHQSRKGVQP